MTNAPSTFIILLRKFLVCFYYYITACRVILVLSILKPSRKQPVFVFWRFQCRRWIRCFRVCSLRFRQVSFTHIIFSYRYCMFLGVLLTIYDSISHFLIFFFVIGSCVQRSSCRFRVSSVVVLWRLVSVGLRELGAGLVKGWPVSLISRILRQQPIHLTLVLRHVQVLAELGLAQAGLRKAESGLRQSRLRHTALSELQALAERLRLILA